MKKIVIAYIPALHEGYIKFLDSYKGAVLFLVSEQVLQDLSIKEPYYSRNIGAIKSLVMQKILAPLDWFSEVRLLDGVSIEHIKVAMDHGSIVTMPHEDISHKIEENYFGPDCDNIVYETIFLRNDKIISQKEFEVSPDRIISNEQFDCELMSKAKAQALKSSDWWRQVGAVAVKDGEVIFSGFNQHLPNEQNNNVLGDPRSNFSAGEHIELCSAIHAEASVIAQAARFGPTLEGASIYVTTFPCPVCAKSIALSGIKKVYYSQGYSLLDAEEIFKAFGIEVILVKDKV